MNTVGIFAGRGDVLVAMALALVIGVWVGWHLKRLATWLASKLQREKS